MDRQIPEPPPPPTPEQLAAERALAVAARAAGEAVAAAIEAARPLGFQPDGYTLEELAHVAGTLKGWAMRLAFHTDVGLVNEWTGRQWHRIGSDPAHRPWEDGGGTQR